MKEKILIAAWAIIFTLVTFQCATAPDTGTESSECPTLEQGINSLTEEINNHLRERTGIRLAIIPFTDLAHNPNNFGAFVAEGLTTRMCRRKNWEIIERSQIDRVFEELEFSVSDVVDETSAQEVGKFLGVEALLTGTVADMGNRVGINSRMIEVETGRVLVASSTEIARDDSVNTLLGDTPQVRAQGEPPPAPGASGGRDKSRPPQISRAPEQGKPAGDMPPPRFRELTAEARVPVRKGADIQKERQLAIRRAVRKAIVNHIRKNPRLRNLPKDRKEQVISRIAKHSRVEVSREQREGEYLVLEVRLVPQQRPAPGRQR